jgi:hypothetical protein
MRSILVIGGVVVGVIVVLVPLIGSQLPSHHTVSRSIVVPRKPAEVYAVVRDFSSAPSWRSDVQKTELTTLPDGKVGFREVGSQGTVNYELSEDVPSQRMVTRITDTDLGYSGSWTYTFAPEQDWTRVTITENGEVSNIVFRFMSRYIFGHTSTIDSYLASLAKRLS